MIDANKNFTDFCVKFILALFMLAAFIMAAQAQALFTTKAKHALLIDYQTGTILFSKEPDIAIPPASLAKLMTVEVVFHALKSGALSMEDQFVISEDAWRRGGAGSGGSTMFAELGSDVSVADLLRGIIVHSANDGSIAIAEGMSGSEDAFAQRMTERAKTIGLKGSTFGTATGLPDPPSRVTLYDMLDLGQHLFREYPALYPLFAEPSFKWNNINQSNRNPLLKLDIGVDGLKTGFTEESGYAIVASAQRDGRRVFLAMSGLESQADRAAESRKLLDWGLRAFDKEQLFMAGQPIGKASVFAGNTATVPFVLNMDLDVLIPLAARDALKAQIRYDGPLSAPIKQGQEIGQLEIYLGDQLTQRVPLVAGNDVDVGSLQNRAISAVKELVIGWAR